MKKQGTLVLAITLLVAGSHAAILEDWQFNDDNGTQLNAVANDGTIGTSWNFGGQQTQNGNLNIGDAKYYKWDVGTGPTYRAASFADLTSGQITFEFVIADWNLGGTDGVGTAGNGIKFNVGGTTGTMQLEFEVSQDIADIRVRSQNSTNGSLSGTDAQNQLGGNDVNNAYSSITVQLNADLDTGIWSTRTRIDNTGVWANLVTDGTGMASINKIQLVTDGGTTGWEYGGAAGTATEYVMIDSVTLSQIPEPATLGLITLFGGGILFIRRRLKI